MHRAAPFLVVLGALALGVALTWPLALHLGDQTPVSRFTEGHIAAFALAARVPPWVSHTDLVGWPAGADFRPLLWPVGLLARLTGPIKAYNLLILCTPALNAWGGILLGRTLGLPSPALLGACLATPAWVRTTLANGQPEQALVGVGAAVVAACVWALAGGPLRAALVALVSALAALACPHLSLAAALVGAAMAVVALLQRRTFSPALVLFGLAAGCGVADHWHGANFDTSTVHFFAPFGALDTSGAPAAKGAARLTDLVLPAGLPPGRFPFVVHLGYLGGPLLLAALLGWRSRATGALPFAVAAAGGTLLALGVGSPLLALLNPQLAGTPYRFVIASLLALSVLAARSRWGWAVPAAAVAEIILVDPRPLPFPLAGVRAEPSALDLRGGSDAVLDLPTAIRCRESAKHDLVQAAVHGRPVPLILRSGIEAYPYDTERYRQITVALDAPDCADRLRPLLSGFAVVAHRHEDCLLRETQLACLESVLGEGRSGGEVTWWEAGP